MLSLVTGGVKSGKSEWAELLAHQSHQPVVYIATALVDPHDLDWQGRIQQHQQRRPPAWQTWEVPLLLPEVLANSAKEHFFLINLIDSLGTWVANWLAQPDTDWQTSSHKLLTVLWEHQGTIPIVAEAVGWGVVPAFRDRLGYLTRQIATIADRTYLVVAGYALPLHQWAEKLPAP
ncbi:MAG: bifunctional adenosylcobinamide kinase/adenosylcobinamide-phosphate guanylyltransferase [Pseudanabaenaceae cyanobacterium]